MIIDNDKDEIKNEDISVKIKNFEIDDTLKKNTFNEHVNNNFPEYQTDEVNDIRDISEKFKIPENLKKTFIVTCCLFALGGLLIGLGFINKIRDDVPGISISMWTLGAIVFIPGSYYAYQFYKAYKASGDDREDILAQIPEI